MRADEMARGRDGAASWHPNRHGVEMARVLYVSSGADAYGPNHGRFNPEEAYAALLASYRQRLKRQHEVGAAGHLRRLASVGPARFVRRCHV